MGKRHEQMENIKRNCKQSLNIWKDVELICNKRNTY